ncbi:carbamoyltransferase C-terminal domain-containing protein [Herpetosiphon gulosus]|uniref:Decarbamoylnovobiocin carbamoyltransferase n=1 Tax=Herpetosiphon gulosus TaxID=1973496 RepID=A0ABP9X7W4_9CHLR
MYVLGLSRHHDSSAALLKDGQIIAFVEEERFNRKKHYGGFPALAAQYCLDAAGITLGDVDHVAYFWQRWDELRYAAKHFVRYFPGTLAALRGASGMANKGLLSTITSDGVQRHHDDYDVGGAVLLHLKRTFTLRQTLSEALTYQGPTKFKIHLVDHHLAHAASTYYISPFENAAILSVDGLGSDGTSTFLGIGHQNTIQEIRRVKFPHSLGAFYSMVTGYLGFYPTKDEGKVMGLAPYGTAKYVDAFRKMIQFGPDGTYELDLSWFEHHLTGRHTVSKKFIETFGPPRPKTKDPVPQHYADIAYALQVTLEEVGLHIARWLHQETGLSRLCVAGGVALNSVMNGRILLETPFTEFFAQPAASDDGTALGAALYVSNQILNQPRPTGNYIYLGPSFSPSEIEAALQRHGVRYTQPHDIAHHTAQKLTEGLIIGWFQGRMECGPRALGNRTILADPRSHDSKPRINEKIKHREPFRPFAPSALEERAGDYFVSDYPSPVMLLVFDVLEDQRDKLPAITHVDGTARVQTVSYDDNPEYWTLIKHFEALTGVGIVVNTSFNDNDEPIVCTPDDAIRCFLKTDLDGLAIGPFYVEKQVREQYMRDPHNIGISQ